MINLCTAWFGSLLVGLTVLGHFLCKKIYFSIFFKAYYVCTTLKKGANIRTPLFISRTPPTC